MSPEQRAALMQDLFSRENGIGLSLTRLTIGASDFSQTHYTYDDMPPGQSDPTLAHFSIEPARTDVIPSVREALAINPGLQVMASSWSAPAWMKSNDSLIQGSLAPASYGHFANYLARYVKAMGEEGVPIFAVTPQNEPHFEPDSYPGMRIEAPARADFIGDHLGPTFEREGLDTLILDYDHNWDAPESPLTVLRDPEANRYTDGVAWHCYGGEVSAQTPVHDAFPDKDAFFTECSGGAWAPNWSESFVWNVDNLIIGTTRNWARGVTLWNLILDENSGPHLGGCGDCRGVVTVNSQTGEVTRNLEYYALGHASRFVRPGAVRIGATAPEGMNAVAFRNGDDGSIVLIALNKGAAPAPIQVRFGGRTLAYTLPAMAAATFVWPE
ncbi:MAG: glycoside hydrolase family 30 beta sandwich domain-containing protein [Terricaulis sp.]